MVKFLMIGSRIRAAMRPVRALLLLLVVAVLSSNRLAAQEPDSSGDLTLVTGEVIEVDLEAGVIVVHVEAVDDLEVEHYDLEIWIDEETNLENESDWEIRSALDLQGTLVDVEGFMDGDQFVADTVWVVEGPVEDELPVDSIST